jgi:hypothetical protein
MGRVAPEQLMVVQMGKKFIAFHGAQMVTVFMYKNNVICFFMGCGV